MKKLRQQVRHGSVIISIVVLACIGKGQAADNEGEKLKVKEIDTSMKNPAEVAEKDPKQSNPPKYDLYHTVRDGENLWILAKNLTGEGMNWKALAEINKLNEQGTVLPGQTIHIPASFSKVAIDSVALENNTALAGKSKVVIAEAQDTEESVTIPATFNAEPTVYFYEESKVEVSD